MYKIMELDTSNNLKVIKELDIEKEKEIKEILEYIDLFELIYHSVESLTQNMMSLLELIENRPDNLNLFKYKVLVNIQNVLSSIRGYIDTFAHTLSESYGKESEIYERFKIEKSKAFDSSKSYRFIEMLRNYVQHRGVPGDKIVRKIEEGKNKTQVILLKSTLLKDKKISAKKKTEILEIYPEEIDILVELKIMYGLLLLIHDKILYQIYDNVKFKKYYSYQKYQSDESSSLLFGRIDHNNDSTQIDFRGIDFNKIRQIEIHVDEVFTKFHKSTT